MKYNKLGKHGIKVSELSLGGWLTYGGSAGEDVTTECIKYAYESGVNFFDTAEVYSEGKSEILMGKALKNLNCKRSDLVISTKIFWGGKGPNDVGLSRKHVIEGLDASLKRLDLEYVDLVFAHRPDPDTEIEEIVRAFNHILYKGKALYWGTSEWSAQQITEAHEVAEKLNLIGPAMEQPEYNMFSRERFEVEYEPLYKKFGMGTTIWSPLASGILTGKYNNGIPENSRLSHSWKPKADHLKTEKGKAEIEKVKKMTVIAESLGCSMAQLALLWCLKNKNVSTVITGSSTVDQLKHNLDCLKFKDKITDEVMTKIQEILN